jgi:RNA polymerase sigma-70 factor (ECF subfamily)
MRRSAPSHAELRVVAGLHRRDPDAVRTMCADYGQSALALLRQALRDRSAVEDVYQQVLLEAWQRSPTYDPTRASLRTWMATIARSRAIDHMRRRVPEPTDPQSVHLCNREPAIDLVDRMALDDLLQRLPDAEAVVVRLRFQIGLSQRQIALHTGVPLGTVKSRNASALRHLRDMLEAERTASL